MAPEITIIILNRNQLEETSECLDSLRRIDYPHFKVIVVDNGSYDCSKEILPIRYPEITLLQSETNLGCAGGRNLGIGHAIKQETDYCLLLDNDAVVDPHILRNFVHAAQAHPLAGVFGAKVYYYHDQKRIWWAKPKWDARKGCFVNIGSDEIDGETLSSIAEIDYAVGCALFFRSEVFSQIGFMDERFFVYYEEIDWCCRARRSGYRILFVPGAKVWHKIPQLPTRKESIVKRYFDTRNLLLYARKNLPFSQRIKVYVNLFKTFFPSSFSKGNDWLVKKVYWDLLYLSSPGGRAMIRGLIDYSLSRFGKAPEHIRYAGVIPEITEKKKILMVLRDFHFPLMSGGSLRTWNFIKALADGHELFLFNICPRDARRSHDQLVESGFFKKVWCVRPIKGNRKQPKSPFQRGSQFFKRIPWELNLEGREEVEDALRGVIEAIPFDIIFVRYILQSIYLNRLPRKIKGKIIVDLDDIETKKLLMKMEVEGTRNIYDKYRKYLDIYFYELYHYRFLRRVNRCLVCSAMDRDYVKKKGWAKHIQIVPNTIATDIQPLERDSRQKIILFVGRLDYFPNTEGILWFAGEIFPRIREWEPEARLMIVGSQPCKEILKLDRQPNIRVYCDVPDVRPFYEKSSAVIAPIRIAGGTRVKVLEAALYQRPVVSTTRGVEGLELRHGRHCLIADEKESFAAACVQILGDENLANRLSEEGRKFVLSSYAYRDIEKQIRKLFVSAS